MWIQTKGKVALHQWHSWWRCSCVCLHACIVKTKRASHKFNNCFIKHGMWKIPGKIRFIWPSERRVQETGSVKVSIMVFTQLVFISVPHCKNIWSSNPPSILLPIHTFSDIGGVGNHLHEETVPAIDIFCSGLPLFSYYSLPVRTVTLSSESQLLW